MKKIVSFLFVIMIVVTGCSGNVENEKKEEIANLQDDNSNKNTNENKKVLVVYFSMPETKDASNMTTEEDNSVVVIDGEVLGNTQYVAHIIQEKTKGELYRIEPEIPYPTDHQALVDLASDEQSNQAKPDIKGEVTDFTQYDVIFLGYPNWWGDMPMILYTF